MVFPADLLRAFSVFDRFNILRSRGFIGDSVFYFFFNNRRLDPFLARYYLWFSGQHNTSMAHFCSSTGRCFPLHM
jgi:hypothetical protein